MLDQSPFEEEFQARPRPRASKLTLGLGAGLVLVVGVIIGIQAQKTLGGAPASAAGTVGQPGARLGYGGQQGAGQVQEGQQGQQSQPGQQGQRGMLGGATVGTVEKVEKDTVILKAADGSSITVKTTAETAVRVTKEGEVADLEAGTTVVVQGDKGEDGSVNATSISQGGGMGARR
ncbi:hypothetical protein AB0G06_16990 [Nonomuraea dietziae]|uniref:hypothetical protein n=1 Tax=Nonomuraea dietziae TaxID=65515 RepID=UPI0033F38CDF